MKDIKLHDQVIYWYNGIMGRGRVLDVNLTANGMIFYIEDITSHQMFALASEQITKE